MFGLLLRRRAAASFRAAGFFASFPPHRGDAASLCRLFFFVSFPCYSCARCAAAACAAVGPARPGSCRELVVLPRLVAKVASVRALDACARPAPILRATRAVSWFRGGRSAGADAWGAFGASLVDRRKKSKKNSPCPFCPESDDEGARATAAKKKKGINARASAGGKTADARADPRQGARRGCEASPAWGRSATRRRGSGSGRLGAARRGETKNRVVCPLRARKVFPTG